MPSHSIGQCKPCRDRGRDQPAVRLVGKEPFCNACWQGYEHGSKTCLLCGRGLRISNVAGYCSVCSQTGAAGKDIKEREAKRREEQKTGSRSDLAVDAGHVRETVQSG